MDSRAALLKGGEGGAAIVPGQPEQSRLLAAIQQREESDVHMPPGAKLPADSIAAFEAWISRGAPWPAARSGSSGFERTAHWAFQPLRRIELPADQTGWSNHPVDRFIAAKWREQNLQPVAPADRQVLVRRVYFDLLGLPPPPDAVERFVTGGVSEGWAALIDRLLESPAYGERWGRHWMDVVRYADTAGDNADYPVPEARLYRDYIIDAFNTDKPFDQFVCEQLAGDILAAETAQCGGSRQVFAQQTIATGFLALSRRFATAPYELWHLTLEDSIDTVGRAFLGLTFKCARCHDHKFDPISQEDYYALYGVFASTQFPWAGGEEFHSKQFGRLHFAPLALPAEVAPQFAAHSEVLRQLECEIKQCEQDGAAEKAKSLKAQLRDRLRTSVPPGVECAYAVREGTPSDVPLQYKGDPAQPGPVVLRRMPRFLPIPNVPVPNDQSGRLQLAQWITHPDNPLTARVMVNRIWLHHFGKALVATPSNFGTRGATPTHPELLDYLAREFVEHGWSPKALHRLILTSQTWQLASLHDERNAAIDPDNRLYWRGDRRRLDAEAIRDALLAVSGTLDRQPPGEHPFPDIQTWNWTQHAPFKDVYPSSHRSVYLMTQRLQRQPFLALFDGPDTNTTTEQRTSSTVPLQALFWINSPLVHEQAALFGRRCTASAATAPQRVRAAFTSAYGREPSEAETERYSSYVVRCRDALLSAGIDPAKAETETWTSVARVVLSANEFIYVD